jgi:hypothetical protein
MKIRVYKTIVLPVVLYGCHAWSLASRGKHKLQIFEKKYVLILGPEKR